MTYQEYVKEYGEVEFEGKKYALTENAYGDNYMVDQFRYFAHAIDEQGNRYRVMWETTYAWDISREYDMLEHNLEMQPDPYERERIKERLAELEEEIKEVGYINADEHWACDWDNPVEVEEV